jgi:hypothetical protein
LWGWLPWLLVGGGAARFAGQDPPRVRWVRGDGREMQVRGGATAADDFFAGEAACAGRRCGSTCRSAASLQVLVAGEAVGWGGEMASGSGRAATLSFVAKFFLKI